MRRARYRLVMRPWLSFLGLRRDSFVYQDKTVRQIVEDVFKDYACANFRFDTSLELRPRSLCTQHRESDLAFVSRLLAEEGLSWHFEHQDEAAAQPSAARPQAEAATEPPTPQARHVLVITDRSSPRPALGSVRFSSQHATANLRGQKDAVTAFAAGRQLQPNAVTLGSWNYKQLAGTQASDSTALDIGELPVLEIYDGSGAYRYANTEHAEEAAARALAALELDFERFEGQGGARHFEAGRSFTLVDHALFGANTTAFNYAGGLASAGADNDFVLLSVEHHATNNLGANAAQLLAGTPLSRGSYKNHFHAARAAAPVLPRWWPEPTAPGLQTALVVGLPEQAISTKRDLRVKIQFPWQRGAKPNAGGLPHASPGDAQGNAPGNEAAHRVGRGPLAAGTLSA
jgi:type VI secretion system secreted protein VgrG